jgi:hypothetical protein
MECGARSSLNRNRAGCKRFFGEMDRPAERFNKPIIPGQSFRGAAKPHARMTPHVIRISKSLN